MHSLLKRIRLWGYQNQRSCQIINRYHQYRYPNRCILNQRNHSVWLDLHNHLDSGKLPCISHQLFCRNRLMRSMSPCNRKIVTWQFVSGILRRILEYVVTAMEFSPFSSGDSSTPRQVSTWICFTITQLS